MELHPEPKALVCSTNELWDKVTTSFEFVQLQGLYKLDTRKTIKVHLGNNCNQVVRVLTSRLESGQQEKTVRGKGNKNTRRVSESPTELKSTSQMHIRTPELHSH